MIGSAAATPYKSPLMFTSIIWCQSSVFSAESGEFLGYIHRLLLGEERFYDDIFADMKVPYVPVRWRRDVNPDEESIEADEKQARVLPSDSAEVGEAYVFTALDATSRMVISFHVGRRDQANANLFMQDLRARLHVMPMLVLSTISWSYTRWMAEAS